MEVFQAILDIWEAVFSTPLSGIALCAAVYWLGTVINRRFPSVLTTPFLLSIIFLILFLVLFQISVENFRQGGDLLQLLIGPATTALGLSIYRQREVIMKNLLPVLAGVVVGSAASVLTVLLLCHVMQVPDVLTNSIVGKSTTTPFAVAIAESRGGIGAVAAVAVLFTGLTGTAFAPLMVKLFRIKNPVAQGLGIGACSHGSGTSRAIQMGEIQGAMSGVAIGLCGISTSIIALFL